MGPEQDLEADGGRARQGQGQGYRCLQLECPLPRGTRKVVEGRARSQPVSLTLHPSMNKAKTVKGRASPLQPPARAQGLVRQARYPA